MSDLKRWQVSDERLREIIRGPASDAGAMATELRDLRAARAADEERVRSVVREAVLQAFEAYDHGYNANRAEMVDHAAARAAKQLATAAVRLSEDDLRGMQLIRLHLDEAGHDWREGTALADVQLARLFLDRLLATRGAP